MEIAGGGVVCLKKGKQAGRVRQSVTCLVHDAHRGLSGLLATTSKLQVSKATTNSRRCLLLVIFTRRASLARGRHPDEARASAERVQCTLISSEQASPPTFPLRSYARLI